VSRQRDGRPLRPRLAAVVPTGTKSTGKPILQRCRLRRWRGVGV